MCVVCGVQTHKHIHPLEENIVAFVEAKKAAGKGELFGWKFLFTFAAVAFSHPANFQGLYPVMVDFI